MANDVDSASDSATCGRNVYLALDEVRLSLPRQRRPTSSRRFFALAPAPGCTWRDLVIPNTPEFLAVLFDLADRGLIRFTARNLPLCGFDFEVIDPEGLRQLQMRPEAPA